MKWPKFGQKTDFLSHFGSFFCLRSMNYTPRFCQMKDLINTYICGKFHQYSICGWEIKNFQSFLYWFSIHEMASFWVFWLLFPQLLFNLDEILIRGSPIRQTHCLKNPSKFWNLAQIERTESLWYWSILGPSLLLENQKYA